MHEFVVMDPHGMGGSQMDRHHGSETKAVTAADEVQAAALATGFRGTLISAPWGDAPGCWTVRGEADATQLFAADGTRVLQHPGTIAVVVVRR